MFLTFRSPSVSYPHTSFCFVCSVVPPQCVCSKHVLLDDDAAPHGFDGTVKNCNKTVAGSFDESSVVFCNAGLDEVALDPLHATVRSFFIDSHQAAVARDIASDNRSKTTRG